ncbi:Signal recognition particle receptor subunit beta [Zalerion maritima]|uniref:Signal recognition particle receptor subunit beta n=1 Tax=Zalerion maritima TaxID=339359 RepID=A0AAD5WNL0_9PEZI|nr:Signal recognition particle receptor subunit beta [Zalerion maritima]
MKDRLIQAFEAIMVPSPTVFIVGALIVLIVPIIAHYYLVTRTDYTVLPSVLLAGPAGAGKTALTVLLERGGGTSLQAPTKISVPETRTSTKHHTIELSFSNTGENTSNDDVNDELNLHHRDTTHTRFLLRDTPGALNRRFLALDYISSSTVSTTGESAKLKAVVFVVDAAALGDDTTTVSGTSAVTIAAEYLYDVLVALQRRMNSKNTSKAPSAVSVLVVANKQDLFTALPANVVRASLEAELTRIRVSKSKGMLESGKGADDLGSDEQDSWLGSYGTEKFTFHQMREFDVEVDVVDGNVLGNAAAGSGVTSWWEWMISRLQ